MQTEIEVPIQPARVTLHRARALRDELEKRLQERNAFRFGPDVKSDITAVALRFADADLIFHSLHSGWDLKTNEPLNFIGKRALEQLNELGQFIAALERKSVRNGS